MIELGRIKIEEAGKQLESALYDEVKSKIITVLLRDGEQLNPTRICDQADIDLRTFYDHIEGLENDGLVINTLIVGNGPVYEANKEAVAKAFEEITAGKTGLSR